MTFQFRLQAKDSLKPFPELDIGKSSRFSNLFSFPPGEWRGLESGESADGGGWVGIADPDLQKELVGTDSDTWFVNVMMVQRDASYFNYRVVVLLAMLSLVASACFVMVGDTSGQLSFISTMLLSVVAFQYTVGGWLPLTSYLTLLDKYSA